MDRKSALQVWEPGWDLAGENVYIRSAVFARTREQPVFGIFSREAVPNQ